MPVVLASFRFAYPRQKPRKRPAVRRGSVPGPARKLLPWLPGIRVRYDLLSTLARLSVEFAEKHGRPPVDRSCSKPTTGLWFPISACYLGFTQRALFDVSLLATGEEDLYTTLIPSPDLTETQLREILYDHLVTYRVPDPDHDAPSEETRAVLAEYNERYSGHAGNRVYRPAHRNLESTAARTRRP